MAEQTEQLTPQHERPTIDDSIVDTFLDSPEKLSKSEFINAVVNGWLSMGEGRPSILPEVIQNDAVFRDENDSEDSRQRQILRGILNKAPFLEKFEDMMEDPASKEMLDFLQTYKHDENYTSMRKATMTLVELWAEQLSSGGDTKVIRYVFDKMINP